MNKHFQHPIEFYGLENIRLMMLCRGGRGALHLISRAPNKFKDRFLPLRRFTASAAAHMYTAQNRKLIPAVGIEFLPF